MRYFTRAAQECVSYEDFTEARSAVTPFPPEQLANFHRLAPGIILCVFGIAIMVSGPFFQAAHKRALGWLAFIGTLAALAGVRILANDAPGTAYSGLIRADAFSVFVHGIVIGAGGVGVL